MNSKDHEELSEIHENMLSMVHRIETILRREGGIEYERAKGYWLASIKMGLTNDHGYLAGSMFNMESAISALEPCEEDQEDQEESNEDNP